MNRKSDCENEKGAGLLELVAAMPLIAILFAGIGTAFAYGFHAYICLLSDWTLQEQVGYAMECMTADLRYAEDVKIDDGKLRVFCRAAGGPAEWVRYEKTRETSARIMKDGQPLTGQSTMGTITIERFEIEIPFERTVVIHLAGKNQLTDQTYELETAVTWTGKNT